jgi:hypothetical protein
MLCVLPRCHVRQLKKYVAEHGRTPHAVKVSTVREAHGIREVSEEI